MQICAYADDIVIIIRNVATLKLTFRELERKVSQVGLKINYDRTKYMLRTKSNNNPQILLLAEHVLEL